MGGNIIVFVLGNLDLVSTEEGKVLPAEQACRH
jgi:hypothetical protein